MKYCILIIILIQAQIGFSQKMEMRSIETLINKEDPGWALVETWQKNAKNKIEILERDSAKAALALYQTQVTTRSPMGAIIYETGGILIDDGWIRILGSGSDKMKRSLPKWNKGKSFEEFGQAPSFLLIADDAIGGFFALNGGGFGTEDLGKIYYLSPENLEWEALGIGYSDFIHWTFTGDIQEFYEGLRWTKWREEVKEMSGDGVMNFYPFLWTQYEDIEKLSRKEVPIEEMWLLQIDVRKQLMEKE